MTPKIIFQTDCSSVERVWCWFKQEKERKKKERWKSTEKENRRKESKKDKKTFRERQFKRYVVRKIIIQYRKTEARNKSLKPARMKKEKTFIIKRETKKGLRFAKKLTFTSVKYRHRRNKKIPIRDERTRD